MSLKRNRHLRGAIDCDRDARDAMPRRRQQHSRHRSQRHRRSALDAGRRHLSLQIETHAATAEECSSKNAALAQKVVQELKNKLAGKGTVDHRRLLAQSRIRRE